MQNKKDPRAIRTKQSIKEALFDLLQNGEEIHDLSVQKVTKHANLNRTTFYLHYEDLDDLLDSHSSELIQEIKLKTEPLFDERNTVTDEQLTAFLSYLQSERQIVYLLIKVEKLEQLLLDLFIQLIHTRRQNSRRLSRNAIIDVHVKASSLVGIIMWWFKSSPNLSPHYIAEQIRLMYKTKL